jgi:hypothetical protein
MSGPIVFVTTFEIHEGKLNAFKEGARRSMEFIEANGPQVMAGVYLDEANLRAHGVQIHRDSESILKHFQLADPYMKDVMPHITTRRVDFYGQPGEAVMQVAQKIASGGAVLTVTPRFAGFERLAAPVPKGVRS